MGKYLQLIKLTLQEHFVYRLNFFLWRLRNLIVFFTLFFFWSAVYQQKETLFGYQKSQMLTYLVGVVFLRSLVLTSGSINEAIDGIRSGRLAAWLLKPVDIFKSFFVRDLAVKGLDFIFCLLEIALVMTLLHFSIYFPQKIASFLFFALACFLSAWLYFYLLLLFAGLAFWIDQVWAVRWLFLIILLDFLSGAFFPLDVFPAWFLRFAKLTPFPYLVYFPLKIWLEKIGFDEILKVLLMMAVWLLAFRQAAKTLWQKGLKEYSVYGG